MWRTEFLGLLINKIFYLEPNVHIYSKVFFLFQGDEKLNINDVWRVGNFKTKEGRLREANNVKHCVDRGYI